MYLLKNKIIAAFMHVIFLWTICNSQTQWKQTQFILGTYLDPPYHFAAQSVKEDSISFQLAKDAYFDLLTGTQEEGSIDHSYNGMCWALKIAQKVGLSYLVSDNRYFQGQYHSFDSLTGTTLVNQYKHLPIEQRNTLYGYNLGDEPYFEAINLENLSVWKWFIEEFDQEKLVYVNLAGSYASDLNWGGFVHGNKDGLLDEIEKKDYEQYLTYYIDSLRPAVVSFDFYPFFKNGTIRRDYFYNLAIIRAKAGSRPFWAYPMTVGHYDYVDPQESHLNFMYFCPIAYGAKGLIVFSFWPPSEKGFRASLFDSHGNKTKTYEIVKRINLYIKKIIAPVVMNVPNIAVYHATNYPNQQQWMLDTLTQDSKVIASIGNSKIMVGVFKNQKSTYLFVVNKDLDPISNIDIVLKGKISKIWFAPSVIGFDEKSLLVYKGNSTSINKKMALSMFTIPYLSGGEGKLVRVR